MKLGERFVASKHVTPDELAIALELQAKHGGQIGEILSALTGLRALDYYRILAEHYQLTFVDLVKNPADPELFQVSKRELYHRTLSVPIRRENQHTVVATANLSENNFNFIREHWGPETTIVATSKFDILWTLQNIFNETYVTEALSQLSQANVSYSARKTFVVWHICTVVILLIALCIGAILNPIFTLLIINAIFSTGLFIILIYKFLLTLVGMFLPRKPNIIPLEQNHSELPVYTILVPLYKEKEVTLNNLVTNLKALDYPSYKLDIKILLEADDHDTNEILKSFHLPSYFEFLHIPDNMPRTKSKACNYALKFARGEYTTIYDAEDQPDPQQLLVVLSAFKTHTGDKDKLACVQCMLNFYNSNENWLTRMFSLEYSYWFDYMLPSLEYLGSPIPLGGTSNHFKTDHLRAVFAWDPYNVAEDADLGTRMARLGYQTTVVPSTTYEEANCWVGNWIKQRSRWVKGYMQTYVVHMRNPFKLWWQLGTKGFLGFQLFVGGTILSNLANLVLWVFFIMCLFFPRTFVTQLFPSPLYTLSLCNFIGGLFITILLNVISALHRGNYRLILAALTAPIYWLLMSIASYKALYQLFFRPNYWEKTEHGISKQLVKKE